MNNKIAFPHLGNYYIPIKYFIKKITKCEIITPNINNQNTIKIGSAYSPNDICMPFKYNLGNYIDALNKGANILIQAGGGCRYGYYAELQEQILENLGYNFCFINLIKNNHVSIIKLYQTAKELNPKLNILIFTYYLIQGILIIIYMDKLDNYRRLNTALAENPEIFNILNKKMLKSYSRDKLSIYKIIKTYYKFKKKYHEIPLKEDKNTLKILLVGELYTLMDSAANNYLENILLENNAIIYRYTNLTYLLLQKKFMQRKVLRQSKPYLKYTLGADGTESVAHTVYHCKKGIDGIIHIKSYGCVPELNAIPILNEVSKDYNVPILYLSYDGENNINNIDTKLEAFFDMLKCKKNNK